MNLIHTWIAWRQRRINKINRKRLTNFNPTLICSNCTGGLLYHWLGLKFYSPFINLYMENLDFIFAMEHFDEFMAHPITEDHNSNKEYPVGVGFGGVRIHFMHYDNFEEAIQKWEQRKLRIDRSNMCVWLSNFNSENYSLNEQKDLFDRFNRLPFKNKLIFTGIKINYPFGVFLKGYNKVASIRNIFNTKNIFGKRYIDQFDYVTYINKLKS